MGVSRNSDTRESATPPQSELERSFDPPEAPAPGLAQAAPVTKEPHPLRAVTAGSHRLLMFDQCRRVISKPLEELEWIQLPAVTKGCDPWRLGVPRTSTHWMGLNTPRLVTAGTPVFKSMCLPN